MPCTLPLSFPIYHRLHTTAHDFFFLLSLSLVSFSFSLPASTSQEGSPLWVPIRRILLAKAIMRKSCHIYPFEAKTS